MDYQSRSDCRDLAFKITARPWVIAVLRAPIIFLRHHIQNLVRLLLLVMPVFGDSATTEKRGKFSRDRKGEWESMGTLSRSGRPKGINGNSVPNWTKVMERNREQHRLETLGSVGLAEAISTRLESVMAKHGSPVKEQHSGHLLAKASKDGDAV
ncbi:hypothetical protein B0H13DRAFT_1888694 [Mycena leptocephala]|nr:hypothetical protein B0H13DRAFT_1888694 [Mycena leptocephala]